MSDVSNSRSFATLRRFIRERPPAERCELCSADLAIEHRHLVELISRKLACACDACSILFNGQAGSKYRRVPRRILSLTDFRMTDAQWDGLMIPINMAFEKPLLNSTSQVTSINFPRRRCELSNARRALL